MTTISQSYKVGGVIAFEERALRWFGCTKILTIRFRNKKSKIREVKNA